MKTDLQDNKKTYLNIGTHLQIWNKIDSLAKSKGMTRKEFIAWSDLECHKSDIYDYEHNLILAYQTSKAIEKLKTDRPLLATTYRLDDLWINKYKEDFNRVDNAIMHLKQVCEYVKIKEGIEYKDKWLLDYDTVLYDRIIEENEGKNKKGRLVRKD